ncbi:hypothetical protein [Streptomyces sp. NPDC006274]|uniref:hypothetical protein n=1 Tax=unclassified Streptomyces TaxID=2593676 RepID=UPI0033A5D29E
MDALVEQLLGQDPPVRPAARAGGHGTAPVRRDRRYLRPGRSASSRACGSWECPSLQWFTHPQCGQA